MAGEMKKPNQVEHFTEEHQNEYRKCLVDPMYFIQTYMVIRHPERGELKFNIFPYQEKIIRAFIDHKYTICLVGRQMGKCVTADTIVNKNHTPVQIGSLIVLSLRDRLVTWLENKLLSLV